MVVHRNITTTSSKLLSGGFVTADMRGKMNTVSIEPSDTAFVKTLTNNGKRPITDYFNNNSTSRPLYVFCLI